MQVSITFRHTESNQTVKDYATQKISRVKKYLDNPMEANIIFSVEKHRYLADVSVTGDGFTLVGEEEAGDFISAIDLVVNKIERQIKKKKGKITNHKSSHSGREALLIEREDDSEEEGSEEIIKTSQIILKPMSIDEAIIEMKVLKSDFLIFSDPENNSVNVLRRRPDGNYDMFETVPE